MNWNIKYVFFYNENMIFYFILIYDFIIYGLFYLYIN